MNTQDTNPDEQALLRALRRLAREDEGTGAPPHVEARLMHAFDEAFTPHRRQQRPWGATQLFKAAAVFVLAVAGGYWWSTGGVTAPVDQARVPEPSVSAPWPSSEALSWLDPEPASLQIVHVRVAAETLAAQGYAIGDPDGDGVVDLEVIVGHDGLARGVRLAPASAVAY